MEAYTVPGWPASVAGARAVMPHMNRAAGSGWLQYKDGITGQPGTRVIPLPGPGVPQDSSGQASMGLSRTGDGPGYFLPDLWYARPEAAFWPGAGMPVALRSHSLMPVPAVDPRGVPARMAVPVFALGQRQVGWPRSVNRWPWANAS